MSYNNHLDGSEVAYLWANQPTTADYQPAANYQANSTGAVNEVTRSDVGSYQVRLPNLGQAGGHVQVTAYGAGSQRCKTTGWGPSGVDQLIGVQCSTAAGSPTDTYFTLSYVRDTNILGNNPICCATSGYPTMYAWADQPSAGSYVPHSGYQFANGRSRTSVWIERAWAGTYVVHDPDVNFSSGNAQVTAYGPGPVSCHAADWGAGFGGVLVVCFDAAGNSADSLFDVSFTGPYQILIT